LLAVGRDVLLHISPQTRPHLFCKHVLHLMSVALLCPQAKVYMAAHEAQRQGKRGIGKSSTLKISGEAAGLGLQTDGCIVFC